MIIIILMITITILIIIILYNVTCSKSSWHFTIVEIPRLLFCEFAQKILKGNFFVQIQILNEGWRC